MALSFRDTVFVCFQLLLLTSSEDSDLQNYDTAELLQRDPHNHGAIIIGKTTVKSSPNPFSVSVWAKPGDLPPHMCNCNCKPPSESSESDMDEAVKPCADLERLYAVRHEMARLEHLRAMSLFIKCEQSSDDLLVSTKLAIMETNARWGVLQAQNEKLEQQLLEQTDKRYSRELNKLRVKMTKVHKWDKHISEQLKISVSALEEGNERCANTLLGISAQLKKSLSALEEGSERCSATVLGISEQLKTSLALAAEEEERKRRKHRCSDKLLELIYHGESQGGVDAEWLQ